MKYGISVYDNMLENQQFMQKYVDSTFATKFDQELWRKFFRWDNAPSLDGQYKSLEIVQAGAVMADVRARFSPVMQRDTNGAKYYLGTIPDLSHGFKEGAEDRVRLKKIAELANGDAQVIAQLTNRLEPFIQGVHARITNMAMQLLSKGEIYDADTTGTGLVYSQPNIVPAANKFTAGVAAWSDATNAKIFTQMIAVQNYVRNDLNYGGALEWVVDRTTMSNILKNKEVKDLVGAILVSTGIVVNPDVMITENQLNTFLNEYKQIAPIVVVDESQRVYNDGGVISTVNGWKAGAAVLRPAGLAGVIKYSPLDELTVVAGEAGINVSYLDGGKIGIKRKFNPATEYWTTDVLAAAVPALSTWNYNCIVDSTTADS